MSTIGAYGSGARGLQVPDGTATTASGHARPRPLPATGRNQVWAYDFVFDTCANGQQIKCLTVVDEWTRESPRHRRRREASAPVA